MADFVGSLKFNATPESVANPEMRFFAAQLGRPNPRSFLSDSRKRQESLECIPKTLLSLLFFPMLVQVFRQNFERNTDARDASEVIRVMWGTPNRERGLGSQHIFWAW